MYHNEFMSIKEPISVNEIMSVNELYIPEVLLLPRLGVGEQERSERQEVRITLRIRFEQPLKACRTDQIGDTLCYHTLRDQWLTLLQEQEFRLIEFLAEQLADIVVQAVTRINALPAEVHLTAHKVNVPLQEMAPGVFFSIRRFISAEPSRD
jgi:FolB domain-containing protein